MSRDNVSGRHMVKYADTKSDPICKWRNATPETVVELVGILPKKRMSKKDFRLIMSTCYNGAFFRTPYQLALQLSLYYESPNEYIPRFDHNITKEEAIAYMQKWIQRYYVPNPYTRKGFVNVLPSVNLLYGFIDYLENHPTKPNLATAGAALFGGVMGNKLCVKYILNEYSNLIFVDSEFNMKMLLNKSGKVDVFIDRDDKQGFFEHFN